MSSPDDEGTFEDEESETQPRKGKKLSIAEMRAQLDAYAEMETKFSEAIRRDAFRSAGVNIDDPKLRYFVKAYDGDLSADAIKAEAEAAGFIAPAPPTTPHEERDGHTRLLNAGVGSEPGPQPWTVAEIEKVSKEPDGYLRIEEARVAGLLNKAQGIES